jgi:UDP-N-acetyl-alpha-D-muramoyl-L-alanyl-L-glutamate epimerase
MRRIDNFSKFQELRKDFPFFSYESYRYYFAENTLTVTYTFSLSGRYSFYPQVTIPFKKGLFRPYDSLSPEALDNLAFHTGMIELISYWKAACPPVLIIKPFNLSETQVQFWKKIFYQGLGEFFYLNSIQVSEEDFMDIRCQGDKPARDFFMDTNAKSLVPVGGGKDSSVSMGILNEGNNDWVPFVINPGHTTRAVIDAAGKSQDETADLFRIIDPLLLKLNSEGFLNGHTPFSALLAFYSLLVSYLCGRSDIILSNESSANEATVPGTTINHQYSKTIAFEKDFRAYSMTFISHGFNYFSLLRPLTEYQIARLFSGMPRFHNHFKSCNVGSKTHSWCGKCPKCLFTYIILSPFLEPDILKGLFGKNLLDDPGLEEIYNELSGNTDIKPFECVGTIDEVRLAMSNALLRYPAGKLPYLLTLFKDQYPETDLTGLLGEQHEMSVSGHFVPEKYLALLKKALS